MSTPSQIEIPEARDAEKVVIGCIISNEKSALEARDLLQPTDFYYPEHAEIFKAAMNLANKNIGIDLFTLANALRDNGITRFCPEIIAVATDCCQNAGFAPYIENYIDILRQKRIHREIQKLLIEQSVLLAHPISNIYDCVENLRQKLFEIDQQISSKNGIQDADLYLELMPIVRKKFEYFQKEKKVLSDGIMTGYKQLDSLTRGIEDASFVIVAARPSVGKTSFALNVAYNLSKKGKKSAFFSFEMTASSIMQRLLSTATQIDFSKIDNGDVTESEMRILENAKEKFVRNITIFDDEEKKVADIRRKARRMKETEGLDVIFVDYIGLVESSGKKRYENRQNEVAEISASLKDLAKSLNIPIVCLSQLSRKPVDRLSPPCMSDLRDSGSLEQDGDIIILLSRVPVDDPGRKNHIVVDVAKQRNGAVGKFDIMYKPETLTFFNVDIV